MPNTINKSSVLQKRRNLRETQTDAESVFWSKIRAHRFFGLKFKRQYSVGPFIIDFFCHEKNVAIEIDGGQHCDNADYDKQRTEFLNAHGIKVIRFWNNDVLKNIEGVLEQLRIEIGY